MNATETLALLDQLRESQGFAVGALEGYAPPLEPAAYFSAMAELETRVAWDAFSGLFYLRADAMGDEVLSVDAIGVVRIGARVIDGEPADDARWFRDQTADGSARKAPKPFRAPVRLTDEQRATIAQLCADAALEPVPYLAEIPCRAYLAELLGCEETTDSNSLWTMVGMDDGCNDEPARFDPAEVCRGVELWSAGINPYTGRPIAAERWVRLERANLHNVDADLVEFFDG